MSRTPIPDYLVHQPDEVDRNGKRFDYLCRLAEEVAFPVVQQALFREFNETAAAGAEILTDEAKQALETLAEDAAILEGLDEEQVIKNLQKSLSEALPPPEEEECRQHTRDFSQILMSTWLESLRKAQAKEQILELSDCLLPDEHSSVARLVQRLVAKSRLPESVTDALALFAPNEEEIVTVLRTLRDKLFAEPRLVDLPFDLAMLGAPAMSRDPARVRVMTHDLFIALLKEIENQQRQERERLREERDRWLHETMLVNSITGLGNEPWTAPIPVGLPAFNSPKAQIAAANLSVALPPSRYRCFAAIKSSHLQPAKIQSTVRKAMAAATD